MIHEEPLGAAPTELVGQTAEVGCVVTLLQHVKEAGVQLQGDGGDDVGVEIVATEGLRGGLGVGVEDAVEIRFHGVVFLPEVVVCGGLQVVAVGDQPVLPYAALAVEGVDRHHDGGVPIVLVALVEEIVFRSGR